MKILIAEDDPSLRENLQWMLELEGYAVSVACDGRQALTIALQEKHDLVLTDVMMPHLDGYGLIQALRSQPGTATVPIVMLTANIQESSRQVAASLQLNFVAKPVVDASLRQVLDYFLA